MNDNKFLIKFKSKTDSELEHIISNPDSYTEEARLAASELLKDRNQNPTFNKKTGSGRQVTKQKAGETATSESTDEIKLRHILSPFKWILIILFFPLSLIFVAYYKQKKSKREYKNRRTQ